MERTHVQSTSGIAAMTKVAVIGTAGRDKGRAHDIDLWCAMWDDAVARFDKSKDYHLISGGAAWADHLAVELYLSDPFMFTLTLYLPAPLNSTGFEGVNGSAGSAANWYHEKFMRATGIDGIKQIRQAASQGAKVCHEPCTIGMGGFFARNKKVAKAAEACLTYTWGTGKEPADGGTKNTWDQIEGRRVHVSLEKLINKG